MEYKLVVKKGKENVVLMEHVKLAQIDQILAKCEDVLKFAEVIHHPEIIDGQLIIVQQKDNSKTKKVLFNSQLLGELASASLKDNPYYDSIIYKVTDQLLEGPNVPLNQVTHSEGAKNDFPFSKSFCQAVTIGRNYVKDPYWTSSISASEEVGIDRNIIYKWLNTPGKEYVRLRDVIFMLETAKRKLENSKKQQEDLKPIPEEKEFGEYQDVYDYYKEHDYDPQAVLDRYGEEFVYSLPRDLKDKMDIYIPKL